MASVFSGKAGRNAAIWTAKAADYQLKELEDIYGSGRREADELIKTGFDQGMGALEQYYPQSRTDLEQGLAGATGTLTAGRDAALGRSDQGYGQAVGALGQYYGQGANALQQGVNAYQPLIDQNMAGFGMYQNALGLGGQEGTQAAQNAFQTGPGYQWNVDQTLSQAQRAGNKMGAAYGGNTADATSRLASNLANQEYGKWIQNLQGFQGASQNAIAGQAGVLGNLAQLYGNQANATGQMYANQGKDAAGLYTGAANSIAGLQAQTGQGLSNLSTAMGENTATMNVNLGQSLANNSLGYMQNLAGANQNRYNTIIPAGQQGMMAGQQAAANRTGAMMGGLQMGAQLLGGVFGAGGGIFGGK